MSQSVSHSPRLDVLSAAKRLRITPELLLSYVKSGAKGSGGQRLAMVQDAHGNFFRAKELDAYDAYLKSSWGDDGAARPAIPKGIRDYLKVEAGGGCAGCVIGLPLEEAHIEPWEVSRSHTTTI